MKLNKDLIREILLYVEEKGNDNRPVYDISIDGYTTDEVKYHFKKLVEAELIKGDVIGLQGNRIRFNCLTWKGHEYLESIKDEYIWQELKKDVELKGITATTLEILKKYADKLIKEKLGIK